MGQKIHPYGFRVGITRPWRSRWYASKQHFGDLLVEDNRIRKHVLKACRDAAVPQVDIERKGLDQVTVFIFTAKPGMLLGKKTNRLTELERELMDLTGGKQIDTRLVEVQAPELNAMLVAKGICEQLERRTAFRRAGKRAMEVVQQAGAKGVKLSLSGRLGGAELSRTEKMAWGSVPLHTLVADVDYGLAEALTSYGVIGVKVWINRGIIGEEPPEPQQGRGGGRGGYGGGRGGPRRDDR
jgi:small subunit ribosomal protein S3